MMDVYKELARQADGKGEEAARNSVIRNLAQMNYRSAPRVLEGRHDGRNFRIYHWSNTPAGDLLLVTGSSVISELIHGSQLSATPEAGAVYVLGSLAGGKVAQKVEAYLKSAAVEKAAKKAAGDGIPPTRATSPKPERAAEGTRAHKPKVEVVGRQGPDMARFREVRQAGRERFTAHKAEREQARLEAERREAEMARFRDVRQQGKERFTARKTEREAREAEMARFRDVRQAGRDRFTSRKAEREAEAARAAAPTYDATAAMAEADMLIEALKKRKAAKLAARENA